MTLLSITLSLWWWRRRRRWWWWCWWWLWERRWRWRWMTDRTNPIDFLLQSKHISNSSLSPPGESQNTIRDAVTSIHGNTSTVGLSEQICLRVVVEEPETNLTDMSDVECYIVAQLGESRWWRRRRPHWW